MRGMVSPRLALSNCDVAKRKRLHRHNQSAVGAAVDKAVVCCAVSRLGGNGRRHCCAAINTCPVHNAKAAGAAHMLTNVLNQRVNRHPRVELNRLRAIERTNNKVDCLMSEGKEQWGGE